MRWEK
jgi:hypothetical protein